MEPPSVSPALASGAASSDHVTDVLDRAGSGGETAPDPIDREPTEDAKDFTRSAHEADRVTERTQIGRASAGESQSS
jgi:hypothetical protein